MVGNSNASGRELVYSFTPATNGAFLVRVTPTNHNALLWVTENTCGGNGSSCTAAAIRGGNNTAELSINGVAGTTYYLHVDSASNGVRGAFTIEVREVE
jgi:hypothetical protein